MTLGEKITALRNENKISQGDLTEKMNVSRQSISKWETGASVPELDKLIILSEIFDVSIDALVKGEEKVKSIHSENSETIIKNCDTHNKTQRIIGLILLSSGLLSIILGILFSRILFVLGLYVVICSMVCLFAKKHAGLIIAWLTVLPLLLLSTQLVAVFRYGISTILFCSIWLFALIVVAYTLRVIYNKRKMNDEEI